MKKIFSSLVLVFSLVSFATAVADDVTPETAKRVAAAYSGHGAKGAQQVRLVQTQQNPLTGAATLYYFNNANGGYVIVSGSTDFAPVIAMSDSDTLDMANIPPAMQLMLDQYSASIAQLQNFGSLDPQRYANEWQEVTSGSYRRDAKAKTYLTVKTEWNQSGNGYNSQCPYALANPNQPDIESNRVHAVVGCVGLALAQVLNYWRYPVCPKDSTTYYEFSIEKPFNFDTQRYDYDIISDKNLSQLTASNVKYEVGKLCFHCGVSVHSSYGTSGTSSNVGVQTNTALSDFFKYSGHQFLNRSNYKDALWVEMLKKEILEKRPVIYQAFASWAGDASSAHVGHAFIITGYRESDGMFKVNWGWGGTGGTWFRMEQPTDLATWSKITNQTDSLGNSYKDTTFTYIYSVSQAGIFGLQPPADSIRSACQADTIYTYDPNVGIQTLSESSTKLSDIYPNPTSGILNVPYSLEGVASADLCIYNVKGGLVDRRHIGSGQGIATINVGSYAPGIYFCRLNGATKRFVVK